jgi:hypothetical protein
MSRAQFGYWRHTHLTIDVVPGRGAGFSVEAPHGVRFLLRSRLLTDEVVAACRSDRVGGRVGDERWARLTGFSRTLPTAARRTMTSQVSGPA